MNNNGNKNVLSQNGLKVTKWVLKNKTKQKQKQKTKQKQK